jgi:hypothetical protein
MNRNGGAVYATRSKQCYSLFSLFSGVTTAYSGSWRTKRLMTSLADELVSVMVLGVVVSVAQLRTHAVSTWYGLVE